MSLKNDLIELKNRSELMLDLAYSAMFLHNRIIASQVKDLYFEYQKILQKVKKQAFKDAYLSKMVVTLHDVAVNAVDLAKLAESKKIPKVVKYVLASSDKRIIEELLSYSSFFVGRTLGELKLDSHTKARVVAVKRKEIWFFNIGKDYRFNANDLIIAVGTKRSEKLLRIAAGVSKLEKIV